MKIVDITPKKLKCAAGVCPAVYSVKIADKNKLAIVGKKVSAQELGISDRVGGDEEVVLVDYELISHLFKD